MSSARVSGCRTLWPSLAALLLLSRCGLHPARAQGSGGGGGHVHQWTVHSTPKWTFDVRHLNGLLVTDAYPAEPCEILRLVGISGSLDFDQCVAPNGLNYKQSGSAARTLVCETRDIGCVSPHYAWVGSRNPLTCFR